MPDKKLYDSFHMSAVIAKKLAGTITALEEVELQEWLASSESNRFLFQKIANKTIRKQDIKALKAFKAESALSKVRQRINKEQSIKPESKKNRNHLPSIAAAAAIVIMLTAGMWLYITKSAQQQVLLKTANNKILPGSNKAVLSLSNGKLINLQTAQNGTIASQGNSLINKTQAGELSYQPSATTSVNNPGELNTLYVPRGGQYKLTLPDGSRVWLNAQSSLKYPVSFNGTERLVELSGEAYFEIAHDSKKPFKVLTAGQVVEVLGTHFNIESYPEEENITTTLLQGSVKVSKGQTFAMIKPGQKVVNVKTATQLTILPANADEALAWKNGYFDFNDERIQDIMKRISRWYDVEIVYQGKIQDEQFWGTFSRSKSLNSLLKSLEQTQTIHFKIEGRRIIVMP
jgi:transmembrane sensor